MAFIAAMSVSPALCAADAAPMTQQQRFGACSKDAKAKGLAGDARKAFMSDCASNKTPVAAAAPMTPQQRMAACNKDAAAKKLSGQPRRDFMSTCLKAA